VKATRAPVVPLLALLVGCGAHERHAPRVAWVVVETSEAEGDAVAALDALRVEPSRALLEATRSGPRVVLAVDVDATESGLRVDVPGSCPLRVEPSEVAQGTTVRRDLVPRVALAPPAHAHDLGYDAPFVVLASLGCDAAQGGTLSWKQTSGPALRHVRSHGQRFEARTAPAPADDVARRPAWGIVPVSAAAAGEVTVEVAWRDPSGGDEVRRSTTVAAASRSHGLPNVPIDDGVLLTGAAWALESEPHGANAKPGAQGNLTLLVPDLPGVWTVRDGAGDRVSIHAGRYDDTALDCGRAPCHASIATAAARSPMTEALRSMPAAARPCAIACHATGAACAHDGGFGDLAEQLGVFVGETAWGALPGAMRRVGGVTCLGCHGPGAIPEASARWAILRSDVCATCHDAPPTYGHVAAWRSSRMARSDADPTTRVGGCAHCHTTSGFLASLHGGPDTRGAPPEAGPVGIGCPACHAPHENHGTMGAPLVRFVPVPAWAAGVAGAERSAICIGCHAPSSADPTQAPSASAAALWAGAGGIDPRSGAPLAMPAVHGDMSGGCLGCHDGGPPDLERGSGHAFRADPSACRRCHDGASFDPALRGQDIRDEAASLLARLARRGALGQAPALSEPGHRLSQTLTDDLLGRATYDVLLVSEDPAAAAHNAPYAEALLAAASAALASPQ
jgi:hypothetical protein